ncbi:MAG: cadherin repeat domain-containing protein, partial [Gammaproteobacteria bacterium]|nr:cadherin repeat domain-containing protein [Gammaproteobacteria bacterium]
MPTHCLKMPFTPLLMMILALFVLTVQGCFHSSDNDSDAGPTNAPPVFTSGTAVSVVEGNTATGYTAVATDTDVADTITYSLIGGEDQAAFSIDSSTGALRFDPAPDFENPTDIGSDNNYVVDIAATDGRASVVQTVTITVRSDADPVGYYINTGTASVDDGMDGTIDINDLQAMVNGTRIIMLSAAHELLYDGTITSTNGNDFMADFTIYTSGENPVMATASGTITGGSSITGTLAGSGVGSGTFSLIYADTNNQTTALDLVWTGG